MADVNSISTIKTRRWAKKSKSDQNMQSQEEELAVPLNSAGLRMRSDTEVGQHFVENGWCSDGINCYKDHPESKVWTSSKSKTDAASNCMREKNELQHASEEVKASINSVDETVKASTIKEGKSHCGMQSTHSDMSVRFNSKGLPIRSGAEVCRYFLQNGWCAYGSKCFKDHPEREVPVCAKSMDRTAVAQMGGKEEPQQDLQCKLECRSYALADFVKYHKRFGVYYSHILQAFPKSLAARYILEGGKGNDKRDGIPDYDVLDKVTPHEPVPPASTFVLHMRTGDVCDRKGVVSVRELLTYTVNAYTKPLPFFHEIAAIIASENISRICIVTGQLAPGSVSEAYVRNVEVFFRNKGCNVEVRSATCYRFWEEVDSDFTFCANSQIFATTGGGFGMVISELVRRRGGKVLDPSYERPEHPPYLGVEQQRDQVQDLRVKIASSARELRELRRQKEDLEEQLQSRAEHISSLLSQAFRIGDFVQVVGDLRSISKVDLATGQNGRILQIDDDGDAQLKFVDLSVGEQWVAKKDLEKLQRRCDVDSEATDELGEQKLAGNASTKSNSNRLRAKSRSKRANKKKAAAHEHLILDVDDYIMADSCKAQGNDLVTRGLWAVALRRYKQGLEFCGNMSMQISKLSESGSHFSVTRFSKSPVPAKPTDLDLISKLYANCVLCNLKIADNTLVQKIIVESPTEYTHVSGMYELVDGDVVNGMALWKKADSSLYIYSGQDGHWYVGDDHEATVGFKCSSGLLRHPADHKGSLPPKMKLGYWQYYSCEWCNTWGHNGRISVKECPDYRAACLRDAVIMAASAVIANPGWSKAWARLGDALAASGDDGGASQARQQAHLEK